MEVTTRMPWLPIRCNRTRSSKSSQVSSNIKNSKSNMINNNSGGREREIVLLNNIIIHRIHSHHPNHYQSK